MKILKDQSAHTTTRAVRVAIYIYIYILYNIFILYILYAYMFFCFPSSMFLKISWIWAWNVSYKFWFTPSPKKGYLQCAQLYFFFKSKVNWTFFPVEMASTLWVWFCLFWCKNNLGVKAFDLIRLHLFFFSIR